MNYFNPQEEFFLIDSDNLEQVKTRFYGFSVQDTGIFDESNITEKAIESLDGCGCYVSVRVNDGKITIQQDFNGNWGIYLFRKDDYFALSSSFFLLAEHLSKKYPLTLNRDYSNHILLEGLASLAYSETPINEISITDKNSVFTIDIAEKTLMESASTCIEDIYRLDTEEGLRTLDHWFDRWTRIFRNLQKKSDRISVALSGGFDSRITFLLLLKSGADLSRVWVHSINDNLHTHAEDYKIASSMAERFGFELNRKFTPVQQLNYSLNDIVNIEYYAKFGFHKEMYWKPVRRAEKQFSVPGAGGECVRAHWDQSATEFIEQVKKRAQRYTPDVRNEMRESAEKIMRHACKVIGEKYQISDPDSKEYPSDIYKETRNRSHFGKAMVSDYFANTYCLTPLIDPDLRKIKLSLPECPDNNLLMAVIYMRYCPELLEFPFEGNRCIDEKTIKFAKELSEKFLRNENNGDGTDEVFDVRVEDEKTKRLIESGNNTISTQQDADDFIKKAFDTVTLHKLFETNFSDEIYTYAEKMYCTRNYHPLRECYAVVAVAKAIENVLFSQQAFCGKENNFLGYMNMASSVPKVEVPACADAVSALKNEVEALRGSWAYRIGKKIVWLPSKIKQVIKKTNIRN